MLNVLFRHADRVKIACLSMLVNVFGPLMTENGGALWKQTIFYPFSYASRYGRGDSLDVRLDSPGYENKVYGHVPFVDVSAVYSEERKEVVFFAVNRSRAESVVLETNLSGFQKVEHGRTCHPGQQGAGDLQHKERTRRRAAPHCPPRPEWRGPPPGCRFLRCRGTC